MTTKNELADDLVYVCRSALGGETRLVYATRQILYLARALGIYQDDVFLPFRGFYSETDTYPEPEQRPLFAASYLEQLDADLARYESVSIDGMRKDLEAVIACVERRRASWSEEEY